jgi:hypothetical protein
LELATPTERIDMIRKKDETKRFFSEMENNIKRRIKLYAKVDSLVSQGLYLPDDEFQEEPNRFSDLSCSSTSSAEDSYGRNGQRIRTISALEGGALFNLYPFTFISCGGMLDKFVHFNSISKFIR